jgi:L-alanine-DL-glutamate epimerase-like enolase superfamily enzyme
MAALSLSFETDPMLFKEPLRIAGYVFEGIPAVRVTLDDGNVAGRGEASGVYYTGDDVAHIRLELERVRAGVEAGIDRTVLQELLPPGGARNALDAALWERESLRTGDPVWKLAGLKPPRPLRTTFTLSADPPMQMLRKLEGYEGASAIKLKLDGDFDADCERIALVRRCRPDVWFMVDANQGYSVDRLDDLLPHLQAADVALLEQPVPRGAEAGLEYIKSRIPIAADESLLCLADLESLVGRFHVANIKLDKCGGLTEALAMVRAARRLGLGVMVGNMAGSSLAAAPAYLLGQLCDFVDLDGPTFIANDQPRTVTYRDGMIHCSEDVWGASDKLADVRRASGGSI